MQCYVHLEASLKLSQVPIIIDAGQSVHANFAEALERFVFQRFLKINSEIQSSADDDLQNIDRSKLKALR